MSQIILLTITLLLSSCATRIVTDTQQVFVPVVVPVQIPNITRPDLAIHTDDVAADAALVRAYKKSIIVLIAHIEKLEQILKTIGDSNE